MTRARMNCTAFITMVLSIIGAHVAHGEERVLSNDTINFAARIPVVSRQNNVDDTSHASPGLLMRLQILTTPSFAQARMASRVAQELFDQPVSVDFESPNFKVRVGRFASGSDAAQSIDRVRQAGFLNPILISQNVLQRADSTRTTTPGTPATTE